MDRLEFTDTARAVLRSLLAAMLLAGLALQSAHAALVISEIDPDQPGSDTDELVEVANAGPGTLALGSIYVVLVNGSSDTSYGAYQFPSASLAPGDTAVVGSVSVLASLPAGTPSLLAPDSFLQNGADAVVLFDCAACTGAGDDFPNGSNVFGPTVTTAGGHTATRLDALVYGTSDPSDLELLAGLGFAAGDQLDDAGDGSLRRILRTGAPAIAFAFGTPTPGVAEFAPSVVPLPAAVWLLASGLIGAAAIARRRRDAPVAR